MTTQLPFELTARIISHSTKDAPALKSLALVSHAFQLEAERHLYHTISSRIDHPLPVILACQVLSREEFPYRRCECVRRFELSFTDESDYIESYKRMSLSSISGSEAYSWPRDLTTASAIQLIKSALYKLKYLRVLNIHGTSKLYMDDQLVFPHLEALAGTYEARNLEVISRMNSFFNRQVGVTSWHCVSFSPTKSTPIIVLGESNCIPLSACSSTSTSPQPTCPFPNVLQLRGDTYFLSAFIDRVPVRSIILDDELDLKEFPLFFSGLNARAPNLVQLSIIAGFKQDPLNLLEEIARHLPRLRKLTFDMTSCSATVGSLQDDSITSHQTLWSVESHRWNTMLSQFECLHTLILFAISYSSEVRLFWNNDTQSISGERALLDSWSILCPQLSRVILSPSYNEWSRLSTSFGEMQWCCVAEHGYANASEKIREEQMVDRTV